MRVPRPPLHVFTNLCQLGYRRLHFWIINFARGSGVGLVDRATVLQDRGGGVNTGRRFLELLLHQVEAVGFEGFKLGPG